MKKLMLIAIAMLVAVGAFAQNDLGNPEAIADVTLAISPYAEVSSLYPTIGYQTNFHGASLPLDIPVVGGVTISTNDDVTATVAFEALNMNLTVWDALVFTGLFDDDSASKSFINGVHNPGVKLHMDYTQAYNDGSVTWTDIPAENLGTVGSIVVTVTSN